MQKIIGVICSIGVLAFCMVAGAAGYKQITLAETKPAEVAPVQPQEPKPVSENSTQIVNYYISANTAIINQTEEKALLIPEDDDLELLAACVEAEAGNQSLYGKRLVADVILNRVDSDVFPDTISGVISQPGQFSVYSNGILQKTDPSDETYTTIYMELEERSYPSLMFFNCGGFLPYGEPWRQVGDHYFSTL